MLRKQKAEAILWELTLEAWNRGDLIAAREAEAHLSEVETLPAALFDLKYPDALVTA